MKIKGYYDLLLKISDKINANYQICHVNEASNNIKDIDKYLVAHLNMAVTEQLKIIKDPLAKIAFLNKIMTTINESHFSHNILLQVNQQAENKFADNHIRLSDNYLFTNENEQALINQLKQEIISCDEVYFIYPFISNAIINKLRTAFDYALKHDIKINLITTTFDGMALFVNLYSLVQLIKKYRNINIKIENNYEKRSQRIHIKAAIFKRDSGFSSAIIGSSNLTENGMALGREWNLKIAEFDNKKLYQTILNEYHKLWNDRLIDFNNEALRLQLFAQIEQQRLLATKNPDAILPVNYFLYDFQIELLNKLKFRRKTKKTKHLIVMATGTGKTVCCAFDYLNQIKENNGQKPTILFLAHQKEIVEQGILTFRKVLGTNNFANMLDPKQQNFHEPYLFATIQTVYRYLNQFSPKQFDIIVFDEAHHIAAKTFMAVFNYFQAKQMLGLTATPEREDNKNIINYFDHEFAYELRLWDAINQKLLSPFDYYCIDDITANLSGVDLHNDQQLFKRLNTTARNELLWRVINDYLGYYANTRCLIFCINTDHAEVIATFLQAKGLKASFLTNKVNHMRSKIINNFKQQKINYLCVVNMFNEGIDIPEIDRIILLRPTNSKTIYLQQLGRGLRKTAHKYKLEVYDLIANIDQKYDIAIGIKNLANFHLINSSKSLNENLSLPYGCTITLEPRSQAMILNNLKKWYQTRTRIYLVVQDYYYSYQTAGLAKILQDYDLTLSEFYHHLNDFYLKIGKVLKTYQINENDSNRNQNILKQFLFLNVYQIVNYFYTRLKQTLLHEQINYHYDNLLICSLFYEVTSIASFNKTFINHEGISDLVNDFIGKNQLIVEELVMILDYKLNHETLLVNEHSWQDYPLLSYKATFSVRQALVAINRVNFIKQLGPLRIIVFQAGYLTFDQHKSVIFADVDGSNYGKLTKYDQLKQEYYWSIPEKKNINSKLVQDLQNNDITKFLFLNNPLNKDYQNLSLKLYDFIGFGKYERMIESDYLTGKFNVEKD